MTKQEIAADALCILKAGKVSAGRRHMMRIYKGEAGQEEKPPSDMGILESLHKGYSCAVCIRGALLLAYLSSKGDKSISYMYERNALGDRGVHDDKELLEYFSKKELALMENLFEKAPFNGDLFSQPERKRMSKFIKSVYYDRSSAEEIMVFILETIIKEGELKLPVYE